MYIYLYIFTYIYIYPYIYISIHIYIYINIPSEMFGVAGISTSPLTAAGLALLHATRPQCGARERQSEGH